MGDAGEILPDPALQRGQAGVIGVAHAASHPPSTASVVPVTKDDASPAR